MAGTVGARDFINGWVQAIAALNPASNFHGVYPPSARVEIGDVVICVDTAPGGVLERYELTGPSGRTVAEWISHPGRYTLQVDGRDLFATSERGRWDAYGELPSKDLAADALRRLMFVPAQRNIPGTVMARRVEVPSPSDPDLGMAIFTRRNDDAPEFFLRDHAEHSSCALPTPPSSSMPLSPRLAGW